MLRTIFVVFKCPNIIAFHQLTLQFKIFRLTNKLFRLSALITQFCR